jgi:hypothetical protein
MGTHEDAMDHVYKESIPRIIASLEKLKSEFAKVQSTTDWTHLRVEPLLRHARHLDELLKSKQFSGEVDRLRRGVGMFHADLVYFRESLQGLKKVLETEKRAAARR